LTCSWTRSVVGETTELGLAQEVGATVPDVDERGPFLVEEGGDDGRPHSLELGPVHHGAHDLLVGTLDRGGEPVSVDGVAVVVSERPVLSWSSSVPAMNSWNRLDGQPRRHLSGGVASHAIRDDEEPALDVQQVSVFVVLSLASDVGETECG